MARIYRSMQQSRTNQTLEGSVIGQVMQTTFECAYHGAMTSEKCLTKNAISCSLSIANSAKKEDCSMKLLGDISGAFDAVSPCDSDLSTGVDWAEDASGYGSEPGPFANLDVRCD